MFLLIKASSPGWEKEYATKDEARAELLRHICKSCLTGRQEVVGEGGVIEIEAEPPPNQSDIHSLLDTPCGCEFWLEDDKPRSSS